MGTPIGIIALSYTLGKNEPGSCNLRLADEINRLADELRGEGHEVFIGVQWEVALAPSLQRYDWCVRPKLDSYLSSKDVIDEVKANLLDPLGITEVVPVVQPFLQSIAVERHIERAGLTVVHRPINNIGHDKKSLQPWTHSAVALVWYAGLQFLTGHKGKLIVTDQMIELANAGLPPRSKK